MSNLQFATDLISLYWIARLSTSVLPMWTLSSSFHRFRWWVDWPEGSGWRSNTSSNFCLSCWLLSVDKLPQLRTTLHAPIQYSRCCALIIISLCCAGCLVFCYNRLEKIVQMEMWALSLFKKNSRTMDNNWMAITRSSSRMKCNRGQEVELNPGYVWCIQCSYTSIPILTRRIYYVLNNASAFTQSYLRFAWQKWLGHNHIWGFEVCRIVMSNGDVCLSDIMYHV